MTRYTPEQYLTLRYATHLDAIRKFYEDIENDRVARERLDVSHLLATRVHNQTDRDTAITSETQQQEAHDNLTNDHHESGSSSPNARNMTIEERLKKMEEVVAQKLKADPPVAMALTLEERVTRLEERFSESRVRTVSVSQGGEKRSSGLASRLPLLGSLQRNEWEMQRYGCYDQQLPFGNPNAHRQLVGPAVRFHEISRDFPPPEVVRPSAVTTVSNIAIIARRLGMSWKDFSPEGGSMRAEGNGHGISSTSASSTGLILQYIHLEGGVTSTEKSVFPNVGELSNAELYIPTREADMMGFGILPGCDSLNVPYFKVGMTDEVYATMDTLDNTHKASTKLRDVNRLLVGKWDAHCMYGFSDIIALAAPMIRCRHSTIIRVPTPAEYCSSLLSHKECFVVFHNQLKEYLGTRSKDMLFQQADWILEQYEKLKLRYSEWENEAENNNRVKGHDLNFLEEVHGCWDTTTEYFVQLQETYHLRYLDLMASHISHAVNYWGDAWQQLNQGKARDNYGLRALEAEGSHLYFDYLPLIVDDMRRKGFKGTEKLVHEAWFTLMFRAFCWWRCHSLHPGEDQSYKCSTLPSWYWDCKLPVYIE